MPTEAQLRREEIEEIATSAPVARRTIRKTGIDQTLASAGLPPDTGQIPSAPQNVVAESEHTSLVIRWAKPPPADGIDRSIIELTHPDGTVRTYDGQATHDSVGDLEHVPYTVRVKLINIYEREGEFSEPIQATPKPTAAYEIDFLEAETLDNLKGQLPNVNLATIEDANKLGDGVVAGRTLLAWDLSAQNAVFQNAGMRSANIESLTVDKLSGGSLTANIITATGRIESGGFRMDSGGAQLLNTGSFLSFPDSGSASKLTNSGGSKWAAMNFFSTTSAPFVRGIGINASGLSGSARNGMIRLCADNGNQNNDAVSTAILVMQSSEDGGRVEMKEDVSVNRNLLVRRDASVAGDFGILGRFQYKYFAYWNNLPPGNRHEIDHGYGFRPLYQAWQRRSGTASWQPVPVGSINASDQWFHVTNNTSNNIDIEVYFYG